MKLRAVPSDHPNSRSSQDNQLPWPTISLHSREAAADLDHVLDGALPEAADFCDVFGENWI